MWTCRVSALRSTCKITPTQVGPHYSLHHTFNSFSESALLWLAKCKQAKATRPRLLSHGNKCDGSLGLSPKLQIAFRHSGLRQESKNLNLYDVHACTVSYRFLNDGFSIPRVTIIWMVCHHIWQAESHSEDAWPEGHTSRLGLE